MTDEFTDGLDGPPTAAALADWLDRKPAFTLIRFDRLGTKVGKLAVKRGRLWVAFGLEAGPYTGAELAAIVELGTVIVASVPAADLLAERSVTASGNLITDVTWVRYPPLLLRKAIAAAIRAALNPHGVPLVEPEQPPGTFSYREYLWLKVMAVAGVDAPLASMVIAMAEQAYAGDADWGGPPYRTLEEWADSAEAAEAESGAGA